jgi:hypothetical protein
VRVERSLSSTGKRIHSHTVSDGRVLPNVTLFAALSKISDAVLCTGYKGEDPMSKARRTEHVDWIALAFQLDGGLRDVVLFGLPGR